MKYKRFRIMATALMFGISWQVQQAVAQKVTDTIHLSPVEVISLAPPLNVKKISSQDIEQIPETDIGMLLKNRLISGGVRRGAAGIDPVIRGMRQSQLNILLDDGIRIEGGCPNRMDPVLSHIEIEDVEQMNILYTPNTLRYGSFIGGVVQVVSSVPQQYDHFEVHAEARLGLNVNPTGQKGYLKISGGNRFFSLLLSGGFKSFGNYNDGNGNGISSSFRKYFYRTALSLFPAKGHQVQLSWISNHARDVMFPALPMDETRDNTNITSLKYQVSTSLQHLRSMSVLLYRSAVDHDMDNSFRPQYSSVVPPYSGLMQAYASVKAVNQGVRVQAEMHTGKIIFLSGLDYEHISKDGNRQMKMIMEMDSLVTESKKTTNLWMRANIRNAGIFTDMDYALNDRLHLNLSVRLDVNMANSGDTLSLIREGVDYFSLAGVQQFNYCLIAGLNMALGKNLSLSVNLGRTMRSPDMTERYIKFLTVGYDAFDYLGNPMLKQEVNNQLHLKLAFSSPLISCEVTPFVSFVQDYISGVKLPPSVAMPKTMGAPGVKQFRNIPFALLTGGELWLKTGRFFNGLLWLDLGMSYTHGILEKTMKYIILNNQVVGEETVYHDAVSEIPPLEVQPGVHACFFRKKITVNIGARLIASQKHVSESMNEATTPGVALVNASTGFTVAGNFSIHAGVQNIFDTYYYEHLNRRMVGSTMRLPEPGRSFYIQASLKL